MIKIRITGDSERECEDARQLLLQQLTNATFTKPREGTNPKYAGCQKWMSYGEWNPSVDMDIRHLDAALDQKRKRRV